MPIRFSRFLVLLAWLTVLTVNIRAAQQPIDGKWLGTITTPNDRIEISFDIHTSPDGKLEALLYFPITNVYGIPVTITVDGDSYKIDDFTAALAIRSGRLEGTITRHHFPVVFLRTGSVPAEGPIPSLPKGPSPVWKTKLGGAIWAPVTTRDGVAYIGTTSGVLNAVQTKDGSFLWTFSAGRPIHGEALTTEDSVYFVCDNGFLYKLDRFKGQERWRYDLGDSKVPRVLPHQQVSDWDYMAPRPVLAEGVIYVGSGDGSLHAVDVNSGHRAWRFATKGTIRTDAVADGDRLYVGSIGGVVYALNRKTGEQIWTYDTGAPVTSSVALIGGKLIVGNRGAGLVALNPADGTVVWESLFWGSWVESTPVAFGELFYIGSSDLRRTMSYDPRDGRVVWRTDVYGWNWGKPAVTRTRVYIGAAGGSPYNIRHRGSLTALDRTTGRIVWRWAAPENDALEWGFPAGPSIDGDILVIGALDGTLYGFPLRNES